MTPLTFHFTPRDTVDFDVCAGPPPPAAPPAEPAEPAAATGTDKPSPPAEG